MVGRHREEHWRERAVSRVLCRGELVEWGGGGGLNNDLAHSCNVCYDIMCIVHSELYNIYIYYRFCYLIGHFVLAS